MKLKLQRLFSEILTEDEIICDIEKYKRNTINLKRDILICLRPTRKEKVVSIVKIANEHNIKLSPISSGNNWGYGSSLPATNDNVILDLSLLNSIIEFNEDLGFIRIGPGLTQGQLYKYLEDNNHNYLVPTTGAGPTCSILGNLLERGYGPTPHQDHFASLHSIEAVLGNGKIYKSPLRKIAGNMLDNIFRGGIGPYLDGIFTQSNYAIVTEATISLVKRPEEVEVFVLELHDKDDLQNIVKDIRSLITQLGGIVGAVNLMNNRRVLSMQTAYVSESDGKNILTDLEIQELAKKEGVCEWTVIGSFYKNKEINKASRKLTQRILKKKNRKLHFFTDRKARLIRKFVSILPDLFFKKFKSKFNGLLNNLIKLIEIFNGKPSKLALPLCYLKKSETPDMNGEINPAQDECGLIWYSPLVPMIPEKISEYVSFVEKVCGKYGIEPLITFTSVSEKCFDSTVPILFKRDKSEVDETAKAHSCYDELLEEGKKLGFYPYRMGINHMSSVVDMEDTFWQLGSDIKSIIDPNEIISPGRYSLK
ncbi:hypothetical protein A9Q84_13420 [Halobacteriovorax marinus]|uniref:FAD-binding PCMH-type domain-containing protein n=1 Tax=Halobacteriovorax marinus TaxID=97084 RepID=A0A1Y5F9N8_9BACT|nr:hypothetical protein A9Q84_13420 [Halobacteriovorax marinus]